MEKLAKRKHIRLKNYDYSQHGVYFLTICAKDRRSIFGKIELPKESVGGDALGAPSVEAPVSLSAAGMVIEAWLQDCRYKYDDIAIDKYVIMPNHIHLLVELRPGPSRAPAPTPENESPACTLSRMNERIPRFISGLKRMTNKTCGCDLWQRGYHDHIVRNDPDYLRIWQYIDTNPAKWAEDKYYTGQNGLSRTPAPTPENETVYVEDGINDVSRESVERRCNHG